ncbi:MAG: DUF1206 domain-containing protein [Jaaginema sp. PMC 1079.18]|nr:DUF1206 domain-containing protein [Jaaginema sp. PMC 1080.18]MEC4852243.1 DUF1206 domain-containing protein [Jaaginema sp. PMC 1079.18]MEC4865087.1 DUF1206 domain-containing protein [Jaaginema sp. PMC 1078.18]
METIARLGYATKGIVYGIVGILAIMAAFTAGGKTTNTKGALGFIAGQPFGKFLLILIAIGLIAYALWRFIEAIQDPEHKGSDAKGIVQRLGYVVSGLIYGSLAAQAILIVTGAISQSQASDSSSDSKQDWTAWVMQQPMGRWLVGLVGAIIIGIGFYRIYKAYKTKFRRKLDLAELDPDREAWAIRISRVGIAARGVVFALTGFFLLQASAQYDPNKVKGLDGILGTLAAQPFGKFLLALAAIGLIAYALYMLIQSRYRRLNV